MSTVKIELDDGKYTYVLHADGRQHALRHGELWRDLVGDKFVYCLAAHAEELREQNEKLDADRAESKRLLLEEMERGNRGTEAALQVRETHEQLVAALLEIAAIHDPRMCMDGSAKVGSPNATGYDFQLIARAALTAAGVK